MWTLVIIVFTIEPGNIRTAAGVSANARAKTAASDASRPGHASGQTTYAAVCRAFAPSSDACRRRPSKPPRHVAPAAASGSQANSAAAGQAWAGGRSYITSYTTSCTAAHGCGSGRLRACSSPNATS